MKISPNIRAVKGEASFSARQATPDLKKSTSGSTDSDRRLADGRTIEVKLQDLDQFFNTIDPSPFHEKDLDNDLEEFIVSWAREYPVDDPVRLVVHLENPQVCNDAQGIIERATHHHFSYRAELSKRELRQLFRTGRISLAIGLSFLTLCLSTAKVIAASSLPPGEIVRESLTIAGWVAMWHPMELYFYGWWPLRRAGRIYRKLSTIPVEIRCREPLVSTATTEIRMQEQDSAALGHSTSSRRGA